MWDDLSTIDRERDAGFRGLLRRHHVKRTTFNDRDLDHALRRWAVRYALATSLARR
jgi:hypothetical protein